jgi:hypothetical protein
MISMNSSESLWFGFEPHKHDITTFLWECKQFRLFGTKTPRGGNPFTDGQGIARRDLTEKIGILNRREQS